MTTFYVYTVDDGFVQMNIRKEIIKKVKTIDTASYWDDKTQAEFWRGTINTYLKKIGIKSKAKLQEAKLTIK